jgi:hypothetical protein
MVTATAGTTYEVQADRIPLGYHVIINSRYEKQETIFGFPTVVRLGVRCCHASDDPCGGLRRPRNCVASD